MGLLIGVNPASPAVAAGAASRAAEAVVAGTLTPSVLAGEKTSDEGLLQLLPLIDDPHVEVRDGVRAVLYLRHEEMPKLEPGFLTWTRYQIATERLRKAIAARAHDIDFENVDAAKRAIRTFEFFSAQFPIEPPPRSDRSSRF